MDDGKWLARPRHPLSSILHPRLLPSVSPCLRGELFFPLGKKLQRSNAMATTTAAPAVGHRVVSREQWLNERVALLAEEKEVMRRRDELAEKIRDLPWVKVDKRYTFDAPSGRVSLADLFGDKSQLMVYHFMF